MLEGYFMLQINSNTDLYDTFLEFLGSKELNKELYLDDFYVKKNGALCGCNKVETVCSSAEKAFTDPILVKDDVGFKLGMTGETPVEFTTNSGNKYYVVHYEEGAPLSSGGATMVHIVFKIYAESRNILQEVVCEIKNIQTVKPSNKIRVFIKGPRASWKLNSELPKRGIESVFHESQDEVLNDIEKFLKSEEEYVRYGIPYKRNYLFHGKPGTGKTSFITSVASKYDFDIYFLTFDSDLDDKSFKMLVSSIPNNGILVIEDVHNVHFSDSGKSMKAIGLSSVLNTLDGLARKNRLLSFMTTNYFDKLEPVLTRPGRIDKIIEFKFVNEFIFKKMFETFLSNSEDGSKFKDFWTKIKSKDVSPAILQKYLFENRDVEDITSKESLKIFYNLLEQYTPKDQYESNRLYM
jgi:SpoVK/Ycf46/Vps4 family AAA+-type ATPase